MQRNIEIINAKFTVIEDSRKPNLMNGRMLSHIRKLWGISKTRQNNLGDVIKEIHGQQTNSCVAFMSSRY